MTNSNPTNYESSKLSKRKLTRRNVLQLGALGMTVPQWFAMQQAIAAPDPATLKTRSIVNAQASQSSFGKAKRCIVMFAWGGMSHIDTFDMKPKAASNVRSAFSQIKTTTPGLHICEHLPHLAKQTHRMAIVRSVNHNAPSHRSAAYWNLTGHQPPKLGGNWAASRKDWPSLASMVWQGRDQITTSSTTDSKPSTRKALPGAVCLPYPMYDGGHANGQDGGFLGLSRDPVIVRPKKGTEYQGKSPNYGNVDLSYIDGVDRQRLLHRRSLVESLDKSNALSSRGEVAGIERYQQQAMDMLLDDQMRKAFDLNNEPQAVHNKYGKHICGQSTLMARKLSEAGVPLVTVYCAAGDLNGSVGAHWDTHGNGFARLKNQMLPPMDQASAALLDDLHDRGTLDDTLVVWLTEFGRTPKIAGGGGRGHYPNVYTVAFAGGGIAGGQLYGSSNSTGAEPRDNACSPADLHATIFHALGIGQDFTLHDGDDRPLPACDGKPLPLFS